jgi:hypothetical protein
LDWNPDLLGTPLTILNCNLQWLFHQFSVTVCIALSLFLTACLQFTTHALGPLCLLSLYQSSGTGFQRRTFPFLSSQTIFAPQSQQLLTHNALSIIRNCFLLSRPVLSGALPITDSFCPISLVCITLGRIKEKPPQPAPLLRAISTPYHNNGLLLLRVCIHGNAFTFHLHNNYRFTIPAFSRLVTI